MAERSALLTLLTYDYEVEAKFLSAERALSDKHCVLQAKMCFGTHVRRKTMAAQQLLRCWQSSSVRKTSWRRRASLLMLESCAAAVTHLL